MTTRTGSAVLETLTSMFNPLPAIALMPLSLLWFGLGTKSLIFVIVHSVLWPMSLNTYTGLVTVPTTLRKVGHNLGLGGWRYVAGILVFAGLVTVIVIGLLVENLLFRWVERVTVVRWGMTAQR